MKTMARPNGPGSSPSGPTPTGSVGKAATIPRAAKRPDPMQAMHDYEQAFWACNGQPNFNLRYADGWVQFVSHRSSWAFDRKRVKDLVEMTARLNARAALTD